MARISLVMIVKNEERVLRRCIESVRPITDEVIVCDTGSTDSTRAIAREYGTVYEIPFTDFVQTKNAALQLANGDYILWMDADEYVVEGLEKLGQHADAGVTAVNARIVEGRGEIVANTYFRPRLWKNDGSWAFAGPGVHEVPCGPGEVTFDGSIVVRHDHSHREPTSYVERFREYVTILTDHLTQHPDDTRAMFYLARTYKDLQNNVEAITWYERYLAQNSGFRDEQWQAAYDIAQCHKADGEYDLALETLARARQIDPRRAEAWMVQGAIFFELQDWEEAIGCYEKARSLPFPDDVVLFIDPRAYDELPIEQLVLCYDKLRRYREALVLAEKLVEMGIDERRVSNLHWFRSRLHKVIFFALGHTPEPIYGDMLEHQGVGGVETTYLELSRVLAQSGHDVFVFGRCEEEHVHDNVRFIPHQRIAEYLNLGPDAMITSRWFEPLYMLENVRRFIWLQDAHFADPAYPDTFGLADCIVCSSRWHRHYIAERLGGTIDARKVHVVPLGIRKDLYHHSVWRDPHKVIYSSNPDRGLYNLIDMWGDISERVPNIHLTITYGWEGLRTWSDDPEWQAKIEHDRMRVENWARNAGNVRLTGRLTKRQLAAEQQSAALCLYPNNFWETFCLTALECQAAGTPTITTRRGALTTTLCQDGNVFVNGNPESAEYRTIFCEETVRLLTDWESWKSLSASCLQHVANNPTDWEDVGNMWDRLIVEI